MAAGLESRKEEMGISQVVEMQVGGEDGKGTCLITYTISTYHMHHTSCKRDRLHGLIEGSCIVPLLDPLPLSLSVLGIYLVLLVGLNSNLDFDILDTELEDEAEEEEDEDEDEEGGQAQAAAAGRPNPNHFKKGTAELYQVQDGEEGQEDAQAIKDDLVRWPPLLLDICLFKLLLRSGGVVVHG